MFDAEHSNTFWRFSLLSPNTA